MTDLLAALAAKLRAVLAPLVPSGSRCALLDFPSYGNVGDSLIWLGARACLRETGARVVYVPDLAGYSRQRLAAGIEDGTIFLNGGGNLGDLWPSHQRFRERILADFPQSPIVQLPQTACFRDGESLRGARAAFDAHPRLTLLLRDRPSLELAQREFQVESALCPDLALALGGLARSGPATRPVVWLARTDHEAIVTSAGELPTDIEPVDWVQDPGGIGGRLGRRLLDRAGPLGLPRAYDLLARQRLVRGCTTLSAGQAVVTDRLHGHLLSLLLGIPHVLVGDAFGKIRDFYETWTAGNRLTEWADTPAQAVARARALAQGPG